MPNSFGILWIPWIVLDFFWYWKCTWKNTFWNCSSSQNFYYQLFTLFPVAPCLDLLFVKKYYFNSTQDNLNNRPSHQLTVAHNRRWMSISKLPCVGCPLTHYSHSWSFSCILEWKQLWSKDCTICGHVILFRVCNQWSMYFMFLFYFLIFACFYNPFDWYDIFSPTVGLHIIFNCY